MRIFVIGFGGAGSRIADTMYAQDRHFSKLSCVEAIAIDRDPSTLNSLRHLPVEKKMFFPSLSQNTDDISDHITVDEVLTRVHQYDTGDRDAIIICGGAGGTMIDAALAVIPKIRSSMVEPVFGLFTLPASDEGRKISAKAAYDLERLTPLLDGIILFDNETWWELAKERSSRRSPGRSRGVPALRPGMKKLPGRHEIYKNINEGIGRRLGLLLRAGEFSDSGGVEIGEVVLDAGEILNTIRGMGFIAIGYSSASLRDDRFSIHRIVRHSDYLVETGHKRASRLVDIAKEAIYENISIPCDMTSARKALILVAGPSHEISMKGYMTVRKWIDRSISGMEVRSGDYPVKTTKYIAIIIILAGITNIPRISEINAVRSEYTKENPEWVSDIQGTSVVPVAIDRKTGGNSSNRESLVPRILAKKRPEPGPDGNTVSGKKREKSESVRTIPFFGRHGTSQRQIKEQPAESKDNGPMTGGIPAPGSDTIFSGEIQGIGRDETRINPESIHADKADEHPVRIPKYATDDPVDEHPTNLANIVAKARKDLENIDKK
ncbi:MAG TPA: tubulin/FtsZ family protein [Methanoregulaceae archaeon]|nr:tubulin/FtsZ family protein [Methanoregulaceae archaeon]